MSPRPRRRPKLPTRPTRAHPASASHRELPLILAPAIGFAIVAAATAAGVTRDIDRDVRRRIRPRHDSRLTTFASAVTTGAAPHVHPAVAGALSVALSLLAERPIAGPAVASLGAMLIDKGMRVVIHQRRPPRSGRHSGLDRYAFPSGHTCAMTAITVAAAHEVARRVPRARHAAWSVAATAAGLVAWSRLYLDEHWVDDIVGGWLAGAAIGHAADLVSRG